MSTNLVTKNLALMEDFDVGINKVTQSRNGQSIVGSRVYVPVPVDSLMALAAIDPASYTYAAYIVDGAPTFYSYDPTGVKQGIDSTVASGTWYIINSAARVSVVSTLQNTWSASIDANFAVYKIGSLVVVSGKLAKGSGAAVTQLADASPSVKTHIIALGYTGTAYVPVECFIDVNGILTVPAVASIAGDNVIFNGSYTV